MLFSKRFIVKETNILIKCDRADVFNEAYKEIIKARAEILYYIAKNPLFQTSLEPIEVEEDAPEIVKEMCRAAKLANVGPFASVAGAIAEYVGKACIRAGAKNVIVENGGDIYMYGNREFTVKIYAGEDKKINLGFRVKPKEMPVGICTSSGKIGHSISFGRSDATVVVADSSILADAAATSIANEVKGKESIEDALNKAKKINGIRGVLIIVDDVIAAYGNLPEIVTLSNNDTKTNCM